MDVHENLPGVTLEAVAEAHEKDLAIQDQYGVDYRRYWVDVEEGKVFCLVEAPTAEAAAAVHKEAHGLLPDHTYPVFEGS
ncbi:nickel-binding protein [Microlunatus elymi]|nr:nickel-binding protein [Microlunatus elymi]